MTRPVAEPARSRRTLWLVLAVCLAPIVASYAAYYLFPRDSRANYGELLATAPLPPIAGKRLDGTRVALADLGGKWLLVVAAPGACAADCERRLYAMRQARTLQGRDQERVTNMWLVTDDVAPPAALLEQHPGLDVVRVPAAAIGALPRGRDGIYAIDPLGNQVLAWPADPDIKAMGQDLGRLLKASRIG